MARSLHPELPRAPELTADEVRDLGDRAAAEAEEDKTKARDDPQVTSSFEARG